MQTQNYLYYMHFLDLSRLLNCSLSFPGHKALNSVLRVFQVFSGRADLVKFTSNFVFLVILKNI